MSPFRTTRLWALNVALCLWTRSAGGDVVGAVQAGGGYDSNLRLAVLPEAGVIAPLAGTFARLAPTLTLGHFGGGFRWEADYSGDGRFSDAIGVVFLNELIARASRAGLGPVSVDLAVLAARLDASTFSEDRFNALGAEMGLRLALGPSLRALTRARFERRNFPDSGATDHVWTIVSRLPFRPVSVFEIAPFTDGVFLRSPGRPDDSFTRFRAGIQSLSVRDPINVGAGVWLGQAAFGATADFYWGVDLLIRLRLANQIDLFADGSLVRAAAAPNVDLSRYVFSVGLSVAFPGQPPVNALPRMPDPSGVPQIHDGQVGFTLHEPAAQEAILIGSWNGWSVPGLALLRGEDGVFRGSFVLPPGIHRFRFLVDGKPRRPPFAARYLPDDFGGEDGVIEIPDSGPAKGVRIQTPLHSL